MHDTHFMTPDETEDTDMHAPSDLSAFMAEIDEFVNELRAKHEQEDRAARAEAMLSAAECVKETGGAVEIAGVRMEPCDEFGQTYTTKVAANLAATLDEADEDMAAVLDEHHAYIAELEHRCESLKASRDEWKQNCFTLLYGGDTQRTFIIDVVL